VPVLADLTINGQPRKVVMFANRNGFFYTIDRVTGKVIADLVAGRPPSIDIAPFAPGRFA